MLMRSSTDAASPALVSKPPGGHADPDLYLKLGADGAAQWTSDAETATIFDSMREATRAALRLPSGLRAFSLPRGGEILAHRAVH